MTLSFITSEKSTFKSFAKEALKRKKKLELIQPFLIRLKDNFNLQATVSGISSEMMVPTMLRA